MSWISCRTVGNSACTHPRPGVMWCEVAVTSIQQKKLTPVLRFFTQAMNEDSSVANFPNFLGRKGRCDLRFCLVGCHSKIPRSNNNSSGCDWIFHFVFTNKYSSDSNFFRVPFKMLSTDKWEWNYNRQIKPIRKIEIRIVFNDKILLVFTYGPFPAKMRIFGANLRFRQTGKNKSGADAWYF